MTKRVLIIVLIAIVFTVVYYQMNYKTLEKAIEKSDVPVDEIFFTAEMEGNTVIIYGHDNILSAALLEKSFFGYHWCCGSGSEEFNRKDTTVTKSITNLLPLSSKTKEVYVTLSMGVINDNEIEKLLIKYKDQAIAEATVLDTKKGRIWFSFSETPINYNPDVISVYKNGTKVPG